MFCVGTLDLVEQLCEGISNFQIFWQTDWKENANYCSL